jgi:Methylase involved in ubiquinone/menaquinone biosynthesis
MNGDEDAAREEAFIYDLYIAPVWREPFNELLDQEVELPTEGRMLEVGCGTGGYAVELSARVGPKLSVIGVDPSEHRLMLARAKADLRRLETVEFRTGNLDQLKLESDEFDLVIGDASMWPPDDLPQVFSELKRVANHGATVALLATTRGSFDEFFSIFWETLHALELDRYTPALETAIQARPTPTEAKEIAVDSKWRNVRSETVKHHFDFEDANAFLTSPLFQRYFFPEWLEMFETEGERQAFLQKLEEIIQNDSGDTGFEVSIKATIIVGRK